MGNDKVVGHDCGHGSFSNYPLINAICGHICHTPLLVPFFPWAYSHRLHHQFHNHVEKDKSHPWMTAVKKKNTMCFVEKKFIKYISEGVLGPFINFAMYLFFGAGDGSHVYPGKLYKNANKSEKIKCVISTIAIVCFIVICGISFSNFSSFLYFYGGCWLFFCFWLFMVTYMQHHAEDTKVYDDSSWNFIDGALETIDRHFGFGIDVLHHHITDCHLVHHLFFTQIPHYHLKKAQDAIKDLLGNKHKFIKHRFFLLDFWRLFLNLGFSKFAVILRLRFLKFLLFLKQKK